MSANPTCIHGVPDEEDCIKCLKDTLVEMRKIPRCPRCGSEKLQCPNGHTWEIN